MNTKELSDTTIANDGALSISQLEALSPKKQRQVILQEITLMHNNIIKLISEIDEAETRSRNIKRIIAESTQAKEAKRLDKQLREAKKVLNTTLAERQGVIRTAKALGIDARKEIESIQQIAIKQIESNHK